MTVRLARADLAVYWRLVEYFAGKEGRRLSEVHAELGGYGLSPGSVKFNPRWDEPRPPGSPSRFSNVFIYGSRAGVGRKKGARRVSREPGSGT